MFSDAARTEKSGRPCDSLLLKDTEYCAEGVAGQQRGGAWMSKCCTADPSLCDLPYGTIKDKDKLGIGRRGGRKGSMRHTVH